MKINVKKFLFVFFLFCNFNSVGQVFTQTFVDRCTGDIKIVTANFTNGSAIVSFYDKVRVFTFEEYTNGTLQAWLIQTYTWWQALSPCSLNNQQSQNAQQTAQNAQDAASNASGAASGASAEVPEVEVPEVEVTTTEVEVSTTETTTTEVEVETTEVEVETTEVEVETTTEEVSTETETEIETETLGS